MSRSSFHSQTDSGDAGCPLGHRRDSRQRHSHQGRDYSGRGWRGYRLRHDGGSHVATPVICPTICMRSVRRLKQLCRMVVHNGGKGDWGAWNEVPGGTGVRAN